MLRFLVLLRGFPLFRHKTPNQIPVHRKLVYSAAVLGVVLVVAELLLSLIPNLLIDEHIASISDDIQGAQFYCIGDSVTEGHGLELAQAYPARLEEMLRDTYVLNMGYSATRSSNILRIVPGLQRLPSEQPPVYITMLGHNDFFEWPENANAKHLFEDLEVPGLSLLPNRGFRLLRIVQHGLTTIREEVPELEMGEGRIDSFKVNIRMLSNLALTRNGQVVLMTYPVPGAPPDDIDSWLSDIISTTRSAQLAINETIRETATELDISLIDLGLRVDLGTEWNRAWYLDNIHLTEAGHEVVAKVIGTRLLEMGLITKDIWMPSGAAGDNSEAGTEPFHGRLSGETGCSCHLQQNTNQTRRQVRGRGR